MNVTIRELKITLKNINDVSKRKYYLESQLGGLKLCDAATETEITQRHLTKKEMDAVLSAIERYLQQEKREVV